MVYARIWRCDFCDTRYEIPPNFSEKAGQIQFDTDNHVAEICATCLSFIPGAAKHMDVTPVPKGPDFTSSGALHYSDTLAGGGAR